MLLTSAIIATTSLSLFTAEPTPWSQAEKTALVKKKTLIDTPAK
jgi:hypothetical protein